MSDWDIDNVFGYHPGTDETIPKHEQCRAAFRAFAKMLDEIVPDGDAKEVVKKKLQETSMWSNFAIAELAPVVPQPSNTPTLF